MLCRAASQERGRHDPCECAVCVLKIRIFSISFFPTSRSLQIKKFEVQSYKSRRKLKFSYKFYFHPSS
jgi:hypothetical protein